MAVLYGLLQYTSRNIEPTVKPLTLIIPLGSLYSQLTTILMKPPLIAILMLPATQVESRSEQLKLWDIEHINFDNILIILTYEVIPRTLPSILRPRLMFY